MKVLGTLLGPGIINTVVQGEDQTPRAALGPGELG